MQRQTPLHLKILFGYLIVLIVAGCMAGILLHEKQYMREIEAETKEIHQVRHDINTVHRHITELATRGESVIAWEKADYCEYRENRLNTDSLLQTMRSSCKAFVHSEQIDTLRCLLEAKETHLLHIMETVLRQEEADSLLTKCLPAMTRQPARSRTVVQKKKGIAGWFGGKKAVQVVIPSKDLQALNDTLVAMQQERDNRLDAYADSLRKQNKELNKKLYRFINSLDGQARIAFKSREAKITEAQELSYRLFAIVIVLASILLIGSFIIIRHDIEKEKRNKSHLQQIIQENGELLEMRKQIILTVSHDIRGPLGNINNCAELALDTREKKKREGYLENIRRSCRHILRLVNDLMDVYKINEARDIRNELPFRLDKLLDSVSAEYSRKANDKALIFESEHEGTRVTVRGDTDKIEQILDNLLTNAIKFTQTGTIRFLSRYAEGKLHVEISDTGIGMDEETMERVFRPFERAAQNVNSDGFGLGLFITKGLVKVLDGTVNVESQPGKGSIFRLVFPLPETTAKEETEEISSLLPTVFPKKVLVVDDDSILLKIAEDMLGRNGVECTTCGSVTEAVSALCKSDYDLVLTDIQMPLTDGFGLLKLLRSSNIGNSRTVPIAVMTARGDGDSGIYVKSGFCGCIHKPFSMKGLLSFISSVVTADTNNKPSFDYDRLMENTDDKRHMFDLVIKESQKDLSELEYALKETDRMSMRKTIHRMMPVWELLGADDILEAYRGVLHDKDAGDILIQKHTRQIIERIKQLIDEVQKKLK